MNKKTVILEGGKFASLKSFYDEVESKFTKALGWHIGRNLDAFNDVLRGGFGVYDYEEPISLIWLSSRKSQKDLGWDETVKYLSAKLTTCHPSNVESVRIDLELAKKNIGKTLFEIIIEIIRKHDHIELSLK